MLTKMTKSRLANRDYLNKNSNKMETERKKKRKKYILYLHCGVLIYTFFVKK